MKSVEDTIAAIATPPGTGGIAVIRVSGADAWDIACRLGLLQKERVEARRLYVRRIRARSGEVLDEGVFAFFKGPESYTGEDVVEISCHGGRLVAQRVLEEVIHAGARVAEKGEFTRRAFLHGKMDLTQVEGVEAIVEAESEAALRAGLRLYEGTLGRRLRAIREELVRFAGLLELELDFAEEDVEFASRDELRELLGRVQEEVRRAVRSYRKGKRLVSGVRTVIVGPPNVGKSSLLNALLEEDRALVTEVPGTTRDTVEEAVEIGGVLFRLVDTAGLRETADRVEILGIDRTWREVEKADLVLLVVDGSVEQASGEIEKIVRSVEDAGSDRLLVVNKIDRGLRDWTRSVARGWPRVEVSALRGEGMEKLEELLVEIAVGRADERQGEESEWLVTTARQYEALVRAEEALKRAEKTLESGLSSEFTAFELREALDAIGEVTGDVTTDEILDRIFENFCIGK
ncbi:MAG: tRNA uridine-5-carboxymethylaminomethyl(34) synthesis GTPase MnmE [Calditrichaeota bacterium]|nr:tRNA uridine-5-carboxymethylaminomethyl(34) synthesis GTPase MnmE [Calditrichota bacterium]